MIKNVFMTVLACLPLSVYAGSVGQQPVSIYLDPANNFYQAGGTLAGARYSADENAMIGCRTWRFEGGGGFGLCHAADASGQYVVCTTYSQNLMITMESITESSYVSFEWRDWEVGEFPPRPSDGACTLVSVGAQSRYMDDTKSVGKN